MTPTSLVLPSRRSIVAGLLALAAFGAISPAHAQTTPAPVEDFFRKPLHGNASLSPSGRYLAVVAPVGGRLGLGIIDLETRKIAIASLPAATATSFGSSGKQTSD